MAKYRVLITARSFGAVSREPIDMLERNNCDVVKSPYDRPLRPGELARIVKGIDGIIVGKDVVDRAALEAADSLRVICMHGVGLDAIDVEFARSKGIVVTNLPGSNADAVAELTCGLIFCLARSIAAANTAVRAGKWERFIGTEVGGKTLGLVGFGHIGKAVAIRAKALGMTVIVYDPVKDMDFAARHGVVYRDFDDVVREADFLSLHVPQLPETFHLIGLEELSKMKRTAYLINTSRGSVVDEDALCAALQQGIIAGAGLDVFEEEPLPADHPLLRLENCILTPHIGARTKECLRRLDLEAAQKVLDVLVSGNAL